MSETVRFLERSEFELWDKFVDSHMQGTIFHTTNWLRRVNPEIEILTVWDGDQIKAGIALIKTKKNGISGYHIPPYTQYYSPLYRSGNGQDSLTDEHAVIKLLLDKVQSGAHIDFKLPRGHQSILPYHWQGFESTVSITHTVSGSLEDYLASLNKNKLRELKKLQKMCDDGELSVEEKIDEDELRILLNKTEARKGFNAKIELVAGLVSSTAGISKVYVIRSKQHGTLAFGYFPYDKHAVYNLVNASIRVSDPVLKTVNLLLIYKAIEFALNTGRIFDFEGSMLPGVESFCRLMGGTQAPVYRVQKSPALAYSILRAAKQIKNDRRKT